MKTEMDFEELMDEAYGLPNGPAKLGMLEEAARVADVNGMEEEAYEARSEIVETATFCGYPMKALIAFSWQLGKFDQQPEEYDEETLMWSYKWILGKMPDFPEISREKIMELLEDFGRRFKSYGYSERSYWYYRFRIFMDFGELEEAGRSYDRFRTMDRDFMSDCEACEQDEIMRYFLLKGDDEKVLEAAQPILKGRMSLCGDSSSDLVRDFDAAIPSGTDCRSR